MPLKNNPDISVLPFLQGGGEMGELIRSVDWAATPLGTPGTWHVSLKQTVSMMLTTSFPVLICWGEDYIQLYNDSFRPINGATKHPKAMGGSARDTYAEIWETIGPMFAGVMKGETFGFPNFMVPLERNGDAEDCYFDFSYSPIRDQDGHIGGVLVICVETTEKVVALNKAALATQIIEKAQAETITQRDRLKRFFLQAPAGICILDGPDLIFELINPLYQQLFPGRELLGKPVLAAIPEIKGQPIWDMLQDIYNTGKTFEGYELLMPLSRTNDGPLENRYFNFIYQARLDTDGKVDGILVFVFEVTEMVEAKRTIQENEKRVQYLLDAIPQQVWTAAPDGALNYVNQVICDDFGYSIEKVIGHGWQKFIHPDDLAICLEKWLAALTSGKEYLVEFRLLFHDNTYRWHLARAVPVIENDEITLWLGTNTNIELQKANEQKKDEFLSIASHELKTPLTSIKAFNQLMKRSHDSDKLGNFIQKSAEHITRLEKLIDDLLDVTKINAGKMNYIMQPFSFKQMMENSIDSVQHISLSHRIILETNENIEYTGDQFRLEQVVNNFLINAIKYSPNAEKVIVNARVELDNIIVSVQDFGIGIAAESLNRLFERYYRVDNTAMRFEGLGLGLFISSEILKRHHGSFWIESELGEGSTFFFRLPLKENEKPEAAKSSDTYYCDSIITLTYNEQKERMDVDWTGFQSLQSVQHGCMLMLEMMKKNKVYKIVNDNTHVLGSWSEAVEWTGNTWFPMMEKAGLKYFALIYSPSVFSQLSAKKSIDVGIGSITAQYFTEISLAEEWVDSCIV